MGLQVQYHTKSTKQIFGPCPNTEPSCAQHNQISSMENKDRWVTQSTDLPEQFGT